MANHGIHKYKGGEFVGYQGDKIEVVDDEKNKAYSIRFIGENVWHDNMDDDDIEWVG